MHQISYLGSSLRGLSQQFTETMGLYFDGHTVSEWLEQHLRPLEETVEALESRQRRLVAESVWPRRPLPEINRDRDVAER